MIEPQLVTILGGLVGNRVFPDVAPEGTALPYCLYEQIGGKPFQYVTADVAEQKSSLIQISVWCETRAQAKELIGKIEDAVIVAPLHATVSSGARSAFDQETNERGFMQDFYFWG